MHYDVADILVSTTRKGIYAVHGADDQHMPGVVAQLTELPVTVLRLLSSQISDHTVAMLARLSQLKELNLEDAPVTDRGIGALGPLKELQILNLKGTRIDGSCLQLLQHLVNLQQLNLAKTKVTDAAVYHLPAWPKLTRLDLSDTPISGACLDFIYRMPNLETLLLYRTALPFEKLSEVAQKRPKLQVCIR